MTTKLKGLNKRAFFRSLDYRPHPGQLAIHASKAPRRIVACGVRWGKTRCAAMEGLAATMSPCDRSFGWVVAPTYDLADKVFREILYLSARYLQHYVVSIKEGERRVVLRNMGGGISEVRAKSADNPVSLLGEGLDWVIADEAARLKPAIWESHLSQRLIDKKGWALLISTPKGKGWFFDLFRRGQSDDPDYASWNAPSVQNPHLDPSVIEAERNRLPDRVFQQEFSGQFLEGAGQVFRNVRESATGEFREPVSGERYFAGLDLAKVEDFTVLTILNKQCEVVFFDRFHRLDWSVQVARIQAATERYNQALINCDTTGSGEPVFESLRKAGCRVEPYPFTQRTKSALVDNLSMMLERGELTLPKPEVCPVLIDELEAFEFSVTESGNVRSGAPNGMHDDAVISLGLAAWHLQPRQRSLPTVTVLPGPWPFW